MIPVVWCAWLAWLAMAFGVKAFACLLVGWPRVAMVFAVAGGVAATVAVGGLVGVPG